MIHECAHQLAGAEVPIVKGELKGETIRIEDWWDRVAGKSWMNCDGNPACLGYAMRTGMATERVPMDNEVVYGKIGFAGYLVHVSELAA